MDNKVRLNEIAAILEPFCNQYLSEEQKGYVINLCNRLGRKRTISITRGKPEIWAASIVYIIARLNFLFDINNPNHITADMICEFFKTKKSTIGNKATQLEKTCKIRIGDEGLCSPHISEMFTFVQTPEGFILPLNYFSTPDDTIEILEKKEVAEKDERLEAQRKQKEIEAEEKRKIQTERKRQLAEDEHKKKFKDQQDLFGGLK